jgi:hypothetical protein
MGLDTKTYWLTDRQSQCDFDFDNFSFYFIDPIPYKLKPELLCSRTPFGNLPELNSLLLFPRNNSRHLSTVTAN